MNNKSGCHYKVVTALVGITIAIKALQSRSHEREIFQRWNILLIKCTFFQHVVKTVQLQQYNYSKLCYNVIVSKQDKDISFT